MKAIHDMFWPIKSIIGYLKNCLENAMNEGRSTTPMHYKFSENNQTPKNNADEYKQD
jgi:hypothetical protein